MATSVADALVEAAVAAGHEPVPDWLEIMKMSEPEKGKALDIAARAIWDFMHDLARTDGHAFRVANVTYNPNLDRFEWGREGQGKRGYRWDGVLTDAYVTLWLSLEGKMGMVTRTSDEATKKAVQFRQDTANRLKRGHNLICVVRGGPNKNSEWFVSQEYSGPPHPRLDDAKTALSIIPKGSTIEAVSKAIRAAGVRTPVAVRGVPSAVQKMTTTYQCREGCKAPLGRFGTELLRDKHEADIHKVSRCRQPDCKMPYANRSVRRQHEKQFHPDLYEKIYPIACSVPGCDERYDTQRGIEIHVGASWHGLEPKQLRNEVVRKILAGESFEGFEWPSNMRHGPGSTTYAAQPEDAPAAATASPEPTQAVATTTTQSVADVVETAIAKAEAILEPVGDGEESVGRVALEYLMDLLEDYRATQRLLEVERTKHEIARERVAELERRLADTADDRAILAAVKTALANATGVPS